MLRKTCKSLLIVSLVLLLMFSSGAAAFAADSSVDFDKKGSITVTLRESGGEHKPIPGATITVYQVANVVRENHNLYYRLTEEFADSGVSLNDLNAEGLAEHLTAYAKANKLTGITKTAGKDGKVAFDNLDLGLYLVAQDGTVSGYYPMAPFLVSVPMTNSDGTGWIYDVDASPKGESKPTPPNPGGSDKDLTVKKVWQDEGDNRPDQITVNLLRDGEVYKTIVLNDENGWKFTWENLSSDYRWSVVEVDVPGDYTVSYTQDGATIIITNTIDTEIPEEPVPEGNTPDEPGEPGEPEEIIPDEPTPSTTVPGEPVPEPTGPKLIQTGQVNWPIPMLAVAGMLLFIFGWVQNRKSEEQ